MVWPWISFLAVFLTNSGTPPKKLPFPREAKVRLVATYWGEQPSYDIRAERELLDLANRVRAQAELGPFHLDEGLTRAAREHATAMAARGQLSHQFSGEPALAQRLAENCSLYLAEAAENVASAESVDRAHDALMHSVRHRENLLRPSYNVAGFGVVRRGDTLYVVQDFGNNVLTISAQQSEAAITVSVERHRERAKLPALQRRDAAAAHKEACFMAGGDALKVASSQQALQGRHILRYTSMQPGTLPAAATQAIEDDSVHAYEVGSCFARSKSYPNGVYWIVLMFF